MNESERFSGLSEAIGANLEARRLELGKSLRGTAVDAAVSPSHLSDIERGRSQVSLPVLLRLVRALDLTVKELLPRIGGNQAAQGSINYLDEPISSISHRELDLTIEHRNLNAEETMKVENPARLDLFIHVLEGEVTVTADGDDHRLGCGDSLDSERLPSTALTGITPAKILVIVGASST